MSLPGVQFTYVDGLGLAGADEDGYSGIVIPVPSAYAGGIVGNQYLFTSTAEAETEGILASEDAAQACVAHYHISEYFRLGGSRLYVAFADNGDNMADLVSNDALSLLTYAAGKIRQAGIVLNPPPGYTATIVSGIDSQVLAAITSAKLLAMQAEADGMPLVVLLEGRGFTGSLGTQKDLRTLSAKAVGVVVAQDNSHGGNYPGHAAVGSVLGIMSAAKVHENIGWVKKFNLQDAGKWLLPGLCNNQPLSSLTSAQLGTLLELGYIYGVAYANYAGVYIADDPACVALSSDYAWLRYSRAVHKSERKVRAAMLPNVNGPVYLEEGKIDAGTVRVFELAASKPLQEMKDAGEISAFDVYINPDQDIIGTNLLDIDEAITPVGCASKIRVKIQMTKQV